MRLRWGWPRLPQRRRQSLRNSPPPPQVRRAAAANPDRGADGAAGLRQMLLTYGHVVLKEVEFQIRLCGVDQR